MPFRASRVSVRAQDGTAPVELQLIGPPAAVAGGVELELPPSKKARALLAYLAVRRHPQRRDHLCSLLWGDAEDARQGLRWCLSRLRKVLEQDGETRIDANRETVALVPGAIDCDFWRLQEIARLTPTLASTAQLTDAVRAIRGDFLEGLDLPDAMEFRLWCMAERENLRRLHVAILQQLCDRFGLTEQALPYARKRVVLEPQDENAHLALLDILIALDRLPEAEAYVEGTRRQFEVDALPPPYRLIRRWSGQRTAKALPETNPAAERQRIHYCSGEDGVRIAYSISGAGPSVMVSGNWPSHLEIDHLSPVTHHLNALLSEGRRLIRYNLRGSGLSDWDITSYTFDDNVRDLEAVADAAAAEAYDLVGICRGCADSIAFAVRHPERVRRLVLIGGSPAGWSWGTPEQLKNGEALVELIRGCWGLDNPAVRQVFTSLMFPEALPDQVQWFNDMQRRAASSENAARWVGLLGEYDVRALLPQVRCPTLVLHSRDDAMAPLEMGRELARRIPGAQFVTLPSRNHLILEHEQAWPKLQVELRAFLAD